MQLTLTRIQYALTKWVHKCSLILPDIRQTCQLVKLSFLRISQLGGVGGVRGLDSGLSSRLENLLVPLSLNHSDADLCLL